MRRRSLDGVSAQDGADAVEVLTAALETDRPLDQLLDLGMSKTKIPVGREAGRAFDWLTLHAPATSSTPSPPGWRG